MDYLRWFWGRCAERALSKAFRLRNLRGTNLSTQAFFEEEISDSAIRIKQAFFEEEISDSTIGKKSQGLFSESFLDRSG
ncbi:MAG: hypothetical protein AB8H47_24440 [Bacteroidia bacterium]